jgi:hypothetical protein
MLDGRTPEHLVVDEADETLGFPSPPPIIDSAANFIGHCFDPDHQTMTVYMRMLLHAGAKTARDAGCETGLIDLLDMEDPETTERAAAVAEQHRLCCYSETDSGLGMASDAFACIAVFCLGAADLYSGDDLEICKIIATAYARASQVLPAELAEEHRSEVLV